MTNTTVSTATVVAQYPTTASATVVLSDLGPDTHWRYTTRCTGCPHTDGYRTDDIAHRYAQEHAKRCHEQPVGDAELHQFEAASYAQLRTGDRVKIAQVYNGALVDWWWPVLTVDHVDWIRDDHTALMLRLADPMPGGSLFALIAGRAMVDAGVRRVTQGASPTV